MEMCVLSLPPPTWCSSVDVHGAERKNRSYGCVSTIAPFSSHAIWSRMEGVNCNIECELINRVNISLWIRWHRRILYFDYTCHDSQEQNKNKRCRHRTHEDRTYCTLSNWWSVRTNSYGHTLACTDTTGEVTSKLIDSRLIGTHVVTKVRFVFLGTDGAH
jgi:hypothetical protein